MHSSDYSMYQSAGDVQIAGPKNHSLRKKQNETHIVFTYWCCLCHFNTSWLLRDTQQEHLRIGSKSRNQVMPGSCPGQQTFFTQFFHVLPSCSNFIQLPPPQSTQETMVFTRKYIMPRTKTDPANRPGLSCYLKMVGVSTVFFLPSTLTIVAPVAQ